jgi:5'-3' exonuclease
MRFLQQRDQFLVVDLSNVVARAAAVADQHYLHLVGTMMVRQRRQHPFARMVYALEGKGTAERRALLPCYKADRIPSPEFNAARTEVVGMLHHTTCWIIRAQHGEADDAIATFVQRPGDHTILSNDRDVWQMICSRVSVQAKVKNSTLAIDRFACRRLFGADPAVIPLAKALMGDASDQIPRAIQRVPKDKLLRLATEAQTAGRIRHIIKTADWLTPKEKERIHDKISVVKLYERLTKLRTDLELEIDQRVGDVKALTAWLGARGTEIKDVTTLVGEKK